MSNKIKLASIRSACEKIGPRILPFIFLSIPLLPKASSILLILYLLVCLISFKRQYLINLSKRKDLVLYMILYMLLVLGLTYTIDIGAGLAKLQTQLSLFVVPMFLGGQHLSLKVRRECLRYFVIGLALAVVLCLANACYRAIVQESFYVFDAFGRPNNIFFYQEFSGILDLHPTYFSLYLGTALFCLAYCPALLRKWKLSLTVILGLLFFTVLFLTSSKAGIFSFIAVALSFQVYKIFTQRRRIHLGFLAAILFGVAVMYAMNPVFYNRSAQGVTGFKKVFFENGYANESTSIRFHLWLLSLNTAKESILLGHGTGSTWEILNRNCLEFYTFSNCETLRNKNSHNQFLNFLVSNGGIAVLVFVLALFIGFLRAYRNRDTLFILFLAFMSLNFLFESLLQRERGIVFFMLFLVMLSVSELDVHEK